MEASKATAMLIILSALVFGTSGQSDCLKDADCVRNQYCNILRACVNYIKCDVYHRLEGSEPARAANQCGDCLSEYATVKTANGGVNESCIQDSKNKEAGWTWVDMILRLFDLLIGIIVIFVVIFCCVWISENMCGYKPEDVPDKSARTFGASAPPLPETRNNNNYGNVDEESLPLSYHNSSSVGENYENMKKDRSNRVTAQPFYPPNWITTDASYEPSDTDGQVFAVTASRSMAENVATFDEKTVPSVEKATEQQSLPVPNRRFAITIADEENSTNTASDNARACSASPNWEERRYQPPGALDHYNT